MSNVSILKETLISNIEEKNSVTINIGIIIRII